MNRPERELYPDRSALHRFGYELRTRRKTRGLSQDRLGAAVHVSGDLVGRIEIGDRRPARDFAERCDRVLDAGGEMVRLWEAAEHEQHEQRRTDTAPVVADTKSVGNDLVFLPAASGTVFLRLVGLTGLTGESTVDIVNRRDFLGSAAALTAVALLPHKVTSLARIEQGDINQTWIALERLFQLDDQHGGTMIYPVAVAMAQKLDAALKQAYFTDSISQQLRVVTATTMEHAGWLAYDAGQDASARRWWLEAIHLARDLGNVPDAHIAALASMSLQASGDYRRARETISLAQAARSAASHRTPSPTLLSILAAREAIGYAQLGDKEAARSSIAEARRWMDQGPTPDEPLWLQFWCPADLASHETRAALALDDKISAEKSARSALLQSDEQRFPRNHALRSVRLGAVLTKTGQLDESISVTTNTVKRIDQISGSRRIVNDLSENLNQLLAQSYEPARQFAMAAQRLLPVT